MAEIKTLLDEFGVIFDAHKHLPTELKINFLEALAELENNDCHKQRYFPKTRLHRVKGIKQAIYRADIEKISGWRIHIQYLDGQIHLKDVIKGSKHDEVIKVINAKKGRYS
jgi:hypothetical protein